MMPSVKEPLAGLALLVILGFLIWYNRPLENARLLDPYPHAETARLTAPGAYEAWLWQDPFGFDPDYGSGGAAEAWALAARGEKHDKNFSTAVPVNLSCRDSLNNILNPLDKNGKEAPKPVVLAPLVKVAPRTVENKEMRTRQRYAVVAGLVESGYRPLEPGALHFCSIQENREKDGRENDDPEMDRREYDMRWERYQYKPNGESGADSTGSRPDIVVAWIDSGIVTDENKFPVGDDCTNSCDFAFKNLLKEIGKGNKLYLFDVGNVLDSEHSHQLKKHICYIHNENVKSAGINSNVGDIQFLKLAGMEVKENRGKCNAEANAEPSGHAGKKSQGAGNGSSGRPTEEPKQCGSKTIADEAGREKPARRGTGGAEQGGNKKTGSEKLAGLLAKELTLRGVTRPSQVMIISEHGSENAAALGLNFRNCLSKLLAGQEGATESPSHEVAQPECGKPTSAGSSGDASRCSDEIRNVFYLKGMDGKIPRTRDQYGKDKNHKDANDGDGRDRDKSGHAEKDKKIPSIELRHSPPLSVGASQLDYFYRLAEEMNNAHHVVDIDKRDSGVSAVVILGSDFNDKLLIIQALREKMPHLLILTTDLDARMLHPKHWRATRNLVVASHFDLRLREQPAYDQPDKPFSQRAYQDQFPPFRDNQQTNIFYRTLSIGKGNAESIAGSEETFPRIFEVGRHGFVRLGSVEEDNKPDYHPLDNIQENTARELWLLFAIAVSLIIFHWAIRPWSSLFSRYLFFGTSVIFTFAFGFGTEVFSTNELKEPFSFADGVSLWPTLFIQIIVILLASMLIFQAMFELDMNSCRLGERYFSIQLSPFLICPNEFELWARRQCRRWRLLIPWLRRIRAWSNSREMATFFLLILSIAAYVVNDVYPSKFRFWACFSCLLWVVAIVYMPCSWNDNLKKKIFPVIFLIAISVYALNDAYLSKLSIGWFFITLLFLLLGAFLFVCLPRHWNQVSIQHWMQDNDQHSSEQVNPGNNLWCKYYDLGRFCPRVTRVMAMWLIFALIETLLVYLLPPWPLPWRGAAYHMAPGIGVLSFTATMLLLFFILDAVRLNFYWIKKLRTQHPWLTGSVPNHLGYQSTRNRLQSLENIVMLVAARTQAVDRLIYYPMFCIMLMLLAKITYFDNQEFPLSKGITFGAAISFLFFSGFVLRHEANELRNCVRKSLHDLRVNNATRRIDETISRIDAIDEGAFQPMLEQPVMQALLIMLASVGLFAGEYLKVFG